MCFNLILSLHPHPHMQRDMWGWGSRARITLVGPCQNGELNPVLTTAGMSREAPSCIVDICRRRSGQRLLHSLHIVSGICPSRTRPETPGMPLNNCRAVLQSPAESAWVGFLSGAAVISGWDQVMPSPFLDERQLCQLCATARAVLGTRQGEGG